MKKRLICVVSLLFLVMLLSGIAVHASTINYSNPHPPQVTSACPPVIVVSGSNYEMGYQFAEQTAPLIYHNYSIAWKELVTVYGKEIAAKEMGIWAYYLWRYNPGLKDWYEGMSKGCKDNGYDLSIIDLVSISLYPTQFWARPDSPYPEETQKEGTQEKPKAVASLRRVAEGHSCTSISATGSATPDGKPVVAVTKMVPLQSMQSFILVAFPNKGPSFVTSPMAGQVSANAGMNSTGFASTNTAIFGPRAWNYPIEGYFHYLPQYSCSVDEALNYLESTPRGGVMGTVNMADTDGNIAVFEGLAPEYAIREPGVAGEKHPFLVQTNHLVNPALQSYNPSNVTAGDSWYRYATAYKYASEAAKRGEIDFDFMKKMLSSYDWYDPETGIWHYNEPGSENLNNNFPGSVTQAIFFPADLIAYFQIGTPSGIGLPGGATGEYVKFHLGDDPDEVTANANDIAFELYTEARNLFVKELNSDAPYLTYSIAQSLRKKLDEAMLEYECGMDRAALAYLAGIEGASVNRQMVFWSDALTHFAKTQLYSQMVITEMERLKN